MKLQISSLFETQMASCRMMKRMQLGSSVYLLLRAFIVIIRNEKNWTMLATVLQVVLYRYTRCYFAQYNWRK